MHTNFVMLFPSSCAIFINVAIFATLLPPSPPPALASYTIFSSAIYYYCSLYYQTCN